MAAAKERTALLEEQKKQAELLQAIAAAEVATATGGLTYDTDGLTGAVTGTATSFIPSILLHQTLSAMAEEIVKPMANTIKDKVVMMIGSAADLSTNSLLALRTTSFMESYTTSLIDRRQLNDSLLATASAQPDPQGPSPADDGARSLIAELAGLEAGVGVAADIAALFQSEYSAIEVNASTDQKTLNTVLTGKLQEHGAKVLDMDNINWTESTTITSYRILNEEIGKLSASSIKLQSVIDQLTVENTATQKRIDAIQGRMDDIEDRTSAAYQTEQTRAAAESSKLNSAQARLNQFRFAKTESDGLAQSAKDFATSLITNPETGRPALLETALQEERTKADFVLAADIAGSGGEAYIERRIFRATRISVIAGTNIQYKLIAADGIVGFAGLKNISFSAMYRLKKPGEITFEKIEVTQGNPPA